MPKPHISLDAIRQELSNDALPNDRVGGLLTLDQERWLLEQLETFLEAAWKFEQEMANGEFVHFGEFRRALVAASGTDRASNPASEPEAS